MQPSDHDVELDAESTFYAARRRRSAITVVAVLLVLVLAGGLHLTGVLPPGG